MWKIKDKGTQFNNGELSTCLHSGYSKKIQIVWKYHFLKNLS